MAAIQRSAVETVRFGAEEQGNALRGGVAGQLSSEAADIRRRPAAAMVDSRRADNKVDVGQRLIQRRIVLDALDQIFAMMSYAQQLSGFVGDRLYKAQVLKPHVLHGAHHGTDIDRVLRTMENDNHLFHQIHAPSRCQCPVGRVRIARCQEICRQLTIPAMTTPTKPAPGEYTT